MTAEGLLAQIKTMEKELAVLKAQVKQFSASAQAEAPVREKRFGDLYGILAGQANSSEEEINAALYRFEWDGKEEGV